MSTMLAGRLVEITGEEGHAAVTTAAMLAVRDAHQRGEPAAWILGGEDEFFPPDAAACGVDLAALAVVRAGETRDALRAADLLLRSGAFGLVVLDFEAKARLPLAAQSRLAALARRHDAAVLCLRAHTALASLRLAARRRRAGRRGRFALEIEILKDKRGAPGSRRKEIVHAPPGLR